MVDLRERKLVGGGMRVEEKIGQRGGDDKKTRGRGDELGHPTTLHDGKEKRTKSELKGSGIILDRQ